MNQFFSSSNFLAKQYGAEYGKPCPGSESEKRSAEVRKISKKKKIVLYFLIFMYINSICSIQHCYWRNVNLLCTRIAHLNGQYHEIFEPFYILFLHLKNSLKQLCWWLRFHVGTLELGWNSVYCKWPKLLYRLKLKRTVNIVETWRTRPLRHVCLYSLIPYYCSTRKILSKRWRISAPRFRRWDTSKFSPTYWSKNTNEH